MKALLVIFLFVITIQVAKAQTTKIQLSGKYKIDTLSDTGRYLKNPKHYITFLGRDMNYFVGLLDTQKVYFSPSDIVISEDFSNWMQQKIMRAMSEKDTLSLQDYVDRYGEKSYRSAVEVGQTKKIVLAILGKPSSSEKKTTEKGVEEILHYKNEYNTTRSYIFLNGVLAKKITQ